jgi:uncharacterized protein with FMN-binding domain
MLSVMKLRRPIFIISGTVIGTVGVLSYVPGASTTGAPLALSSPSTKSTTSSLVSSAPSPTSQTTTIPVAPSTPLTTPTPTPTTTAPKKRAPAHRKVAIKARVPKPATQAPTQAPIQTPTPIPVQTTSTRELAGSTYQTPFGPVQVQITVQGTKIISARALQSPRGGRSSQISQQAVPYLIQETLAAQSANIQGVGGATYTSDGWAQSLQSALSQI